MNTVLYVYRRSGFDCEVLMIANCEFFWSSQSKESQSILERITIMLRNQNPSYGLLFEARDYFSTTFL